jgi:DNA-binding transcriptional LysR family regulator
MARINYDFHELRSFVAVAELGSFRAAADELSISAPALSRRVDRLERVLGTRLLERTTRRVALTNVGRIFLEHARAALDELEGATLAITELAEQRVGLVTVGCVPSAVYYFLPEVLKAFSRKYPRIRVRIIDEGANEVLASVVDGRADFGLNFIGSQTPGIDFTALYRETFVLAVRRDSPFAKRKSINWSEIGELPFISVARTSGNRLLLDVALAKSGIRVNSQYEVSHVSTLLGLVEAGLGVAAIPRLAMPTATNHPTLAAIELSKPSVDRTVGLITRHGHTLSPPAAELVSLLRTAAKKK